MNGIMLISLFIVFIVGFGAGYFFHITQAKKDEDAPPQPDYHQVGMIWKRGTEDFIFMIKGALFTFEELVKIKGEEAQLEHSPSSSASQKDESGPSEPEAPPPSSQEEKENAQPESIIQQVDDILQKTIAKTTLSDRGIRLMEGPEKQMLIWIGLDSYESIDAIPDENIQKVIRFAVKTWEDRHISND
jgi:hypothetical protein